MKFSFKVTVFLIFCFILVSCKANPKTGGKKNVSVTDTLAEIDTVAELTKDSDYYDGMESGVLGEYHEGMKCLEKGDTTKALMWMKKAALNEELSDMQDGCSQESAIRFVVWYYYKLGNIDKALLWCKKHLGLYGESYKESDVYYLLATYLDPNDDPVLEVWIEKYKYRNKEQAIEWYRKAARQGHKQAQQKLKEMGKTW